MPARPRWRLVQPGQPGGQLLQLPAGHELIEAAEVCHNMLAHPAALAPALDQLQVLVAAIASANSLHLRIHVAATLGIRAGPLPGDTLRMRPALVLSLSQHNDSRARRRCSETARQSPRMSSTITT